MAITRLSPLKRWPSAAGWARGALLAEARRRNTIKCERRWSLRGDHFPMAWMTMLTDTYKEFPDGSIQ